MMSSPDALDETPAVDSVYQSIREQILSGEQAGGEWLRESDLAANLGVSRTPVREALRRLSSEGLLRHERNRGVQALNWTFKDLQDIYELRSLVEPWACGLAAASGHADVPALSQLADRMDAVAASPHPDLDGLTGLNSKFHDSILESAENERVRTLLGGLVQLPFVWRTYVHYTPEELRRSLAHHHEIVDALSAGNSVWAESVMRAHIQSAWTSMRRELGH